MDVDLRVLLKKYIDVIVRQEGTDYLNFVGEGFTDDEIKTLQEIAWDVAEDSMGR